ncbi:MAG: MFS transporter [Phycisphaerales bacterium]|nr:MFS transporter [Phycisphaerales bacterium]
MPENHTRPDGLPTIQSWTNWGIGTLYVSFAVFSVVSFGVLTNSIEEGTKLDVGVVSSLASLYFIVFAFSQFFAGLLIDRFGPKWLIGSTALMATVGGFLFVSSTSAVVLYIARGLMGVGLASSFVGGLYLARSWFPASRYAFMSGLTQMIANLVGAFGSILIAGLGYVSVVMISACINVGIVILIFCFIKSRVPVLTGTGGANDPTRTNLRSDLINVFRTGQVLLAALYFACTFGTFLIFTNFWNIPLQEAYGHDAKDQAIMNAALPIGTAIGSVFVGWISTRLQMVAVPARILAILSTIALGLLIYLPGQPTWGVLLLLFLVGFALGGAMLAFPAASRACPAAAQGTAIGLVTTVGNVAAGGVNLVITECASKSTVLSKFLAETDAHNTVQPEVLQAFQGAFLPLMILMALAIPVSFLIHDGKEQDAPETPIQG